jgi:sigma-54 specific flagellar transcriptional regulator A
VPADFRLVAATNRDLAAEVEAGTFRRDLYYRLLVCPIDLPPLRERRQDVAPLFDHFWGLRGDQRPVEPALLRLLEEHQWPGNVRELENLVERLAVCSDGPSIGVGDLPRHLRTGRPPLLPVPLSMVSMSFAEPAVQPAVTPGSWGRPPEGAAQPSAPGGLAAGPEPVPPNPPIFDGSVIDLPTILRRMEQSFIDAALSHTCGNKKAAADLLGLQRTTLVEKLRRRTRDASVC